jgi:hypothetical protein
LPVIAALLFMFAFAMIVYSIIETLNDANENFPTIEANLKMANRAKRTIRLGEPRYHGARASADILQLPLRLEMPLPTQPAQEERMAA